MQRLPRWTRRVVSESIPVLILALTLACERSTPAAGKKDTAVPTVPPPDSAVVAKPEPPTWDSTAGPALFVVGPTSAEALVIVPRYGDSTAVDSTTFDLGRVRAIQVDLFGRTRGGRPRWYHRSEHSNGLVSDMADCAAPDCFR